MANWYENEKKVIELAEFLVHSEEITSTEELLEYFRHPEKYTGVWNIYEKEILGTIPTLSGLTKKKSSEKSKNLPKHKEISCACGTN